MVILVFSINTGMGSPMEVALISGERNSWEKATQCMMHRNIDGFQSRDKTAMSVHKTIENYGSCFAL